MILCEWDAPEGDPGQSCVHLYAHCSYPIIVTHLSFNFLCLLLLYSIYLNGYKASPPFPKLSSNVLSGCQCADSYKFSWTQNIVARSQSEFTTFVKN